MKRMLAIFAFLGLLSGCAQVKGVAYTYTGLSHPTLVTDGLYLMNRYQRADSALLKALGVNAVLDVADDVKPNPGEVWIPLTTAASPGNEAQTMKAALQIRTWLVEGRTVGVGCWFAENRGPWVVAETLTEIYGGTRQGWLDWLMVIRPEVYRLDWMAK